MKVSLLASTQLWSGATDLLLGNRDTAPADHLAEIAGRACYQSWHRPSPKTAANADYIAHIIEVGHESVLSHASATFYIEGVSRSLTHELVRHRWLSFSELSQRYVNAEDFAPVYPPAADESDRTNVDWTFRAGVDRYAFTVKRGEQRGLSRKEARQAARAHLPLCTETKVVVSGNLRAWRDFLRQRLSPHADDEIRLLAEELLVQLVDLAPATFADLGRWEP